MSDWNCETLKIVSEINSWYLYDQNPIFVETVSSHCKENVTMRIHRNHQSRSFTTKMSSLLATQAHSKIDNPNFLCHSNQINKMVKKVLFEKIFMQPHRTNLLIPPPFPHLNQQYSF